MGEGSHGFKCLAVVFAFGCTIPSALVPKQVSPADQIPLGGHFRNPLFVQFETKALIMEFKVIGTTPIRDFQGMEQAWEGNESQQPCISISMPNGTHF